MSFAADDLTPLLTAGQESNAGMTFGQAVVLEWDALTAANKVSYHGATLTDLPILGGIEALLLQPGSVVGIFGWRTQLFIIGRITVPNTPSAGDALNAYRTFTDTELNNDDFNTAGAWESRSGPIVKNVPIGTSGRALVTASAAMLVSPDGAGQTASMIMAYRVLDSETGAVVQSETDELRWLRAAYKASGTTQGSMQSSASRQSYVTGLSAGLYDFETRYNSSVGTGFGFAQIAGKVLNVTPL